MRWLATSLALAAVLFGLGLAAARFAGPAEARPAPAAHGGSEKIEPSLLEALDVGTGQVDFIVHLQSQAELPPPLPGRASLERRQAVVAGLRAAAAGQTALGPVLRRLSAAGHVGRQQGLWIVNAILVTGDRAAALALAERPEVARIQLDRRVQLIEPPGPAPRDPDPLRPWGIERVRAPQAWYGLGLDGANVTVAIMDTGVDWLHPDLQPGYRGFNGGEPQHVGNWFDAVGAAPAPIDPYGHGTHVAGTAVGRDGIGVAPGAKWIAVRILDDQGFGTLGSIHQGFEWLLAPAGNPALAPDIVNASWGGHPAALDFLPDVNALRSAGILAIFAAGNGGPAGGSVLAPASYPGALAVGASDDSDEVTWFSSRGPSPHTAEAKPFLVAPGAAVRSSLPGGEYGTANGTSMATPHASGSFALLMQAAPNLGLDALTAVLTATAAPLSQTQPNYVSGWGRLDIYAAAAELVDQGLVSGSLSSQGQPLVGNDVTLTNPAGDTLSFRTGPDGAFQAELLPGLYQLSAEPFGYYPLELSGLAVSASEPLAIDAELVPLPAGYVFGYVEDAAGEPLAAVISAAGTPISTTSQASGAYWLRLPAGAYELTAEALGYQIGRASVSLEAGHTLLRDFGLPAGPRVLLVDSGRWYYGSQAGYFRAALSDAGYAFDELSVRSPHGGAPEPAELEGYDAVVWSAPHDSPGLIAAGDVVSGYLQAGGNLLISGQEIGEQEDLFGSHYWWSAQLQADFLGKEQAPTLLQGVPGTIFEGLSIHLNGPNSAANQVASDRVAPRYSALSRPAARYPGGSAGALEAGLCQPFRMVYLGFGLEGMDGRAGRAALLGRAFDYFAAPRQLAELAFEPPALDETALAGRTLSYTVVVRNLSETLTDTLSLSLAGADWPTAITTPTLTLGPCGAGAAMISVTAPAGLAPDQVEAFEVVARSANDPGLWRSLPVRLEAPAPILLVDDDRWYDQAPVYQGALKANGYDFDFWEIGHFPTGRGSPAPELLEAYDMVLWYTGYDWFEPLTASESQSLADYLAAGGRLFLSSQDYMAYHLEDGLTRDYFRVGAFHESVTPTAVLVTPELNLAPGPYSLAYGPYQNFSDGLSPAGGAAVAVWHNRGQPAAVASAGDTWRATLWAFPLETLPAASRAPALRAVVSWLSDLGPSTLSAWPRSVRSGVDPGEPITYTLRLRRVGHETIDQVWLTNTLPAELVIDPDSILGGAAYDPIKRTVTWQGELSAGQEHVIAYQARPAAGPAPGTRINNQFKLHYAADDLSLEQAASVWLDAPDYSLSELTVSPIDVRPGELVSVTARLHNAGWAGGAASASLVLPLELTLYPLSLDASQGNLELAGPRISWTGSLEPGQEAVITFRARAAGEIGQRRVPIMLSIDDGQTELILHESLVTIIPARRYFPFVALGLP